MNGPEILIPITLFICFFAMVFSLRYFSNRERMSMIQNGMDPGLQKSQPQPFVILKWALLLMGAGIGLFTAYILDNTVLNQANGFQNNENPAVYFALIGIFGGLGLFISYIIEKKETISK
ncbi:DUF6249 domain-containing protein [Daejeonella oryzae]|uniref:DUF6249 domain-containing protein n=1 Tax=Daejeonella oryzae TaxID=1122943 RepID=UPI00055CE240|nr:DUF6249 domain-containing protein [Daejeonella oryzae]